MKIRSKIKGNIFYTHKTLDGKFLTAVENKKKDFYVIGFIQESITKAKISAIHTDGLFGYKVI